MNESYCTVSQFSGSGSEKYYKNCGPTAVTNVILTLLGENRTRDLTPKDIFKAVSGIGTKKLIYWNMDRRFLGGTNDILTPVLVSDSLKKYGLAGYSVLPALPAFRKSIDRALDRGSIILLNVRFHPKYGFHDVILYGRESGGYRTADGWTSTPQILYTSDLKYATFTEIRKK